MKINNSRVISETLIEMLSVRLRWVNELGANQTYITIR